MIPTRAQLLTQDQVKRVHEASLEILDTVGLIVRNEKAYKRFVKHGAREHGDNERIYLPPPVVEAFLAMVPPTFTFHGRDPDFDITLPDDGPVICTASSAPDMVDPVSGEVRRATSDDIARIAHLINALPGYDILSVSTLAADWTEGLYSLSRFYPALKNCKKPIRASLLNPAEAVDMIKMCAIIAGSEEAFRERPFFTFGFCSVIAPLAMDFDATEMLMYYAENDIPGHSISVPNGGLSSPFTLAGTLAQGNAEFLAATVLSQMSKAATPVLYSCLPTITDLRNGAYASGAVETGMLEMGIAQMSQFYSVPCGGYVGQTNSKVSDAQAGYEKAMGGTMAMLSGFDFIQLGGLLDTLLAFDLGQAVIDGEIGMMLKRLNRGFEFSEENLGIELIKEIGPGGMFVGHPHTYERMRDTSLLTEIADRLPRETWAEAGSMDTHGRALLKARDILTAKNDAVFSVDVDKQIRDTFKGLVKGDSVPPDGWTAPDKPRGRRKRTGRRG